MTGADTCYDDGFTDWQSCSTWYAAETVMSSSGCARLEPAVSVLSTSDCKVFMSEYRPPDGASCTAFVSVPASLPDARLPLG